MLRDFGLIGDGRIEKRERRRRRYDFGVQRLLCFQRITHLAVRHVRNEIEFDGALGRSL